MLYMVTFTINISQMLAYIPYMDPMGKELINSCCISVYFLPKKLHCPAHVPGKVSRVEGEAKAMEAELGPEFRAGPSEHMGQTI